MASIKCAHCKSIHSSVAAVYVCFATERAQRAQDAEDEAQAKAECLAEQRNERFFEERGRDDGFEDWEARRGVLSYEQARDEAAALADREPGTHYVPTDMGVYLEVDNLTGRTVDVG